MYVMSFPRQNSIMESFMVSSWNEHLVDEMITVNTLPVQSWGYGHFITVTQSGSIDV